jgi:hypothetical protein
MIRFGKYHHVEEAVDPETVDREARGRDERLIRDFAAGAGHPTKTARPRASPPAGSATSSTAGFSDGGCGGGTKTGYQRP